MKFLLWVMFGGLLLATELGVYGQDVGLNAETCGTRAETRIIGGTEADLGEWPWQIALLFEGSFICGGSLITDQWVLTAAHCIDREVNASIYSVQIGLTNLTNPEDTAITIEAEKTIVHEGYTGFTTSFDIALIKLSQKVELNDAINTVCVADKSLKIPYGDLAWTTGWGRFNVESFDSSEVLMQVQLPLLQKKQCQKQHGGDSSFPFDFEMNVCAGESNTPVSACQGDSGGPLVINNKEDQKWYLIGATSYGPSACSGGVVYTRVSSYTDWITNNLESN